MRAVAIAVVVAAVVFSVIVGRLAGFACSSGEEARGSLEADLCDTYAGSLGIGWWLAVLWPAVVFGASQLVPALRRRPLIVAVPVAVLAVGFWVATAALVIDV